MAGGAISSGIFVAGSKPLEHPVGLLFLQILIILSLTRALAIALRPLRQPRVIAEIIGGVLLGPSVLGRSDSWSHHVFPTSSIPILETLATLGIVFYLFLVGMELDVKALRTTGKAAFSVSVIGFILPFGLAAIVAWVIYDLKLAPPNIGYGYLFLFTGVAMGVTAFPVLARILAELRLLTDEVGRIAMAAAALADVVAWILLALTVAVVQGKDSPIIILWIMLTSLAFVAFMWLFVKPVFDYVASKFEDRESVSEFSVVLAFLLVIASGLTTEAIGIHPIFGGFIAGAILQHDSAYALSLVEKVEDFAAGLFLPLYFAVSGLKTNVGSINSGAAVGVLVILVAGAVIGKVVGCTGAALACKIPFRNSLTLGVLMSTKGLVELIVLNVGLQAGVLNAQLFAIFVIMALVTTFITTPLVVFLYPPARRFGAVSHVVGRNLASLGVDAPFKLLVAVWSIKDVPPAISLIEMARPGSSKAASKQLLKVQAVHVTELSERSSAIMGIQRRMAQLGPAVGLNSVGLAFKTYSDLEHSLPIRTSVLVASNQIMHEEISTTALKGKAELIVVPVRKMGPEESSAGSVLQVATPLLKGAPCSVAFLVDCGLSTKTSAPEEESPVHRSQHNVLVFFFGGADDREALVLAGRISRNPKNSVRVVRFVDDMATKTGSMDPEESKERFKDDAALARFSASIKQEDDDGSVPKATLEEVPAGNHPLNNVMEVAQQAPFDLAIVGRNVRNYPSMLVEDALKYATGGTSKRGGLFTATGSFVWAEKLGATSSMISPSQAEVSGSSEAGPSESFVLNTVERAAFGPVAEVLLSSTQGERKSVLIVQKYKVSHVQDASAPASPMTNSAVTSSV